MIDRIIEFSIKNKLIIGLFVLALIGWGSYSLSKIPLDAIPDITNNQIQVITQAPDLATQEVEQFITYPLEMAMSFIPGLVEIRSISRFGLSVITVVFEETVDPYRARQLVNEQIQIAREEIPEGFGIPQMAPMVTGLSEVYQYVLEVDPEADTSYSPMELRTIQDWVVKRQLAGVKGVAEVSSFGGYVKQYEVAIDPEKLKSYDLTLTDVYEALHRNNQNTGGSYIEKTNTYYFIRGEGMAKSQEDVGLIVVKTHDNIPVLIRDIAEIKLGHAQRFGAITRNGQGEAVGGLILMLKGENSYRVTKDIKARVAEIQENLPPGISIHAFLDRSNLISRAIHTVTKNLVEGGLIVIFILVILLGNFRAGIVVASVIPLSMLFALGMMNLFGVSANLMSLGAIDFGLIVDGSVIIVEAIVHRLQTSMAGQTLNRDQMDKEVNIAAGKIRKSAAFGEIIILIVYLPILALSGIEGKMFAPMAQTVSFAILGALILSLTYVPMMSALILKKKIEVKTTLSDHIMNVFYKLYDPVIRWALKIKLAVIGIAVLLFVVALVIFNRLGGEFIPTLEEGDFALHQILPTGTSLNRSIETSEKLQKALMENFPEVKEIVTKIGTSEIPTDPMSMEVGDIIVVMKDKKEWVSAATRDEMFEKMEEVVNTVPGVGSEYTQPIQMRFNELMTGVRQDIAIKIYGEDLDLLYQKANEASGYINQVKGIGGTVVEQVAGLPQVNVKYDRQKIAQYGLKIDNLNRVINSAFAGGYAGLVFEGEKRFDLVVRLQRQYRQDLEDVRNLYISLPSGDQVPLREVADIKLEEAPAQISRDNAKRRIVIGVNALGRDTESIVEDIRTVLAANLDLPPGYYITYGGQFENLVQARQRLAIAVPAALGLIFVLLFFTFNSVKQALLIFTAVPLAAIGGVLSLWIRDMPFSISAGVGFIALFGVAVLNGIVLIAYFNQLKEEGVRDIHQRILKGTHVRLRPVVMTAAVASLGFLPMALSTSAGAEVQRPLATVVIGGLITATFLTMIVLPVLYYYLEKGFRPVKPGRLFSLSMVVLFSTLWSLPGKSQDAHHENILKPEDAVKMALENHPAIKQGLFEVSQQKSLKKSSFDLGSTNLFYQVEETNGEEFSGIRSIGIQQNIDFPLAYIKRKQLQENKVELVQKKVDISRNDLIAEVLTAFQQALYAKSRLSLMRELNQFYADFEQAARLRYDAGETGKLDWVAASGKRQRVEIQQNQAQADLEIAINNLRLWISTDEEISLTDSLIRFSIASTSDTANLPENPYFAYYDKSAETAGTAWKAQRAEFFPQLNLGYSDQAVQGQEGFYLYKIGITMPLFFWAQQGRTEAAKFQAKAAQETLALQQLNWQREYAAAVAEQQKLDATLRYYEKQGLELAEEQLRASSISYKTGEIDYITYTQNLQQVTEIREEFLNYLLQYNLATIEVARLTGHLLNIYR